MLNFAVKLFLTFLVQVYGVISFADHEDIFKIENVSAQYVHYDAESRKIIISEYFKKNPPAIKFTSKNLSHCLLDKKICDLKQSVKLNIKGLPKTQIHRLTYESNGKKYNWEIHLLPDFPEYTVNGKSKLKKPWIFSIVPANECKLIVLDENAELSFYRKSNIVCLDFRPHKIDGKNYYSYLEAKTVTTSLGGFGYRYILNENFELVKKIERVIDSHEFLLFDLNHYVAIIAELNRTKSGRVYIDKRIREFKDDRLLFDWGVSDYLKQFDTEALPGTFMTELNNIPAIEMIHFNSIQVVDKESYIISMGENGVGYLNKKSKTIDWNLGGFSDQFSLKLNQFPHFQHTASWNSKSQQLTIYQNRSCGPLTLIECPSRVLKYNLDIASKSLKSFEVAYKLSGFCTLMGSVQVDETGILSVGCGGKVYSKHDLIEVDQEKETFSLVFKNRINSTYRVYREP